MGQLTFVLSTFALLAGFVALVRYESSQQTRFFAAGRDRFDKDIERIEFIMAHVDFGAFVRDEVRHALTQVEHAIAHLSLQIVRAMERLLTRIVRRLRMRREESGVPRESTREFVKTLSDFKDELKETHPEISDIH